MELHKFLPAAILKDGFALAQASAYPRRAGLPRVPRRAGNPEEIFGGRGQKPLAFFKGMGHNVPMAKNQSMNELFSWLRTQPNDVAADTLYRLLYEEGLTEASQAYVRTLLRKTNMGNGQKSDNEILTDSFLTQYHAYRALGLTSEDAGQLLGVSKDRMRRLLLGDNITNLHAHKRLLEAELTAELTLKRDCLMTVGTAAAANGNVKAALAILERRWPKEWGKREMNIQATNVTLSSDDNAQRAMAAQERLMEIRKQRNAED